MTSDPNQAARALERLQSRYEQQTSNPKYAREYAYALSQNRQYDKSYEILVPLAESENFILEDFKTLSFIAAEIKDIKTAQDWLVKALEKDKTDYEARMTLARLYIRDANLEKANALYAEALTADNPLGYNKVQFKQTLNNAIMILIEEHKHEEALTHLLVAKEKYPEDKDVERNIRISRALMQSYGHSAPKPLEKPEHLKKL